MKEQPSYDYFKPESEVQEQRRALDFVKRLGSILLASFAGSALYTLVVGPRNLVGLSNGLFFAGAILLIVGLMPLIREIFGRTTVSRRLKDHRLEGVSEEEQRSGHQGDPSSTLFGVSGVIVLALSFIIGLSVG
jgi:hypothetical protein